MKVDNLIEMVQDDCVMDMLVERLLDRLTPRFEKMFAESNANYTSTLEAKVEELTTKFVETLCEPLSTEIGLPI